MSAPQTLALNAVVFQLVATLERYEQDADDLLREWPETQRYDAVRRHMDQIQMFSTSLPSVAVAAVALLIAHSELVFTLWRSDVRSSGAGDELLRARSNHRECVAALRARCLRELSRHEHDGPM